jgi:hypothetical protein
LLTEVSVETEDGNVIRSRLQAHANYNEPEDMVNRTAEQLQKELSSFLSNDTIFQAAMREEDQRRMILEEVRANGPNYMRQTYCSAGRVSEKSRAGSPSPGRAQSPFVANRLAAVRSPSPRNRMPPTDLPLAERPWVPGGVLDLTVSNGAARQTSIDRDGLVTSTSERAQACCEALYHDAFERKERQSTLRQEAYRERLSQEKADREATLADISRSRRAHVLQDIRTREERDNELLAKREQLCRQAEAEERKRIKNETTECTFKPILVAEEKRRAPRKAFEEPAGDKGRAVTARQKKALGALALLERSEAEESKSFQKERESVQVQMQREETSRVLSFLRTPEGTAFLRSRMAVASSGGAAVSLSMRQAEIIEELVAASTAQVERRVEDVMRSRQQSTQSKLQYRRLRVLAELDAVHLTALQLPGFPPGFDEHAAARVRKVVETTDLPPRPPSPSSSVPRGEARTMNAWPREAAASPQASGRPVPPPLKVPIIGMAYPGAYPTPTSAGGSSLSYASAAASMGPYRRESPRTWGF